MGVSDLTRWSLVSIPLRKFRKSIVSPHVLDVFLVSIPLRKFRKGLPPPIEGAA